MWPAFTLFVCFLPYIVFEQCDDDTVFPVKPIMVRVVPVRDIDSDAVTFFESSHYPGASL